MSKLVRTSDGLVRIATSLQDDPRAAVGDVLTALRPGELAGMILFCADDAGLAAAAQETAALVDGPVVVGCTTAGEITPWGPCRGSVTAVGFPKTDFSMLALRFDGLADFDPFAAHRSVAEMIADAAVAAAALGPALERAGLLLIDGLSCREELVTHTMRHLLGDIPMIGGSAGDGMAFRRTHLLHGATVRSDRAVLVLLTARRPLRIFRSLHHAAGDSLAVITQADAAARKVLELNGEPAAREYARLVGVDILSDRIFAEHPMMVRVGGQYHARAVMRAEWDESLVFHSAIERGLVLRLGHSTGALRGLGKGLAQCDEKALDAVIAFNSVQNWLEIEAADQLFDLLEIYRANRFVGFQTYGEQYRDLHLNRSLLGLAIGTRALC